MTSTCSSKHNKALNFFFSIIFNKATGYMYLFVALLGTFVSVLSLVQHGIEDDIFFLFFILVCASGATWASFSNSKRMKQQNFDDKK